MERIKPGGFSAAIEAAYARIPSGFLDLLRPHFFCGADPVLAGLHGFTIATLGRSYRETAHVAYLHNQDLSRAHRHTTVVVPSLEDRSTAVLVHELGHVLHERLAFEPESKPVTKYAQTDRYESFAEAFTAYVLGNGPEGYGPSRDLLYESDRQTVALFDGLRQEGQWRTD